MILSCCFLSIGYASIANINLSLTGTAQLDKQTGIVISSVVLDNYSGVDPDLSEINTYYKTMLDSKIVLGNDPTDPDFVGENLGDGVFAFDESLLFFYFFS